MNSVTGKKFGNATPANTKGRCIANQMTQHDLHNHNLTVIAMRVKKSIHDQHDMSDQNEMSFVAVMTVMTLPKWHKIILGNTKIKLFEGLIT